ncbi:MAG: helix-turn-helix transcriptional regulator, partial [Candidatus Competibacteraceae bacterium]|nr:helix-turn-helix transcriptional regulator [Candidatus Competibacteraceae bacterium]
MGVGFDLGARLRVVREARGLSQRELARRAGVTNGTISLIEQN